MMYILSLSVYYYFSKTIIKLLEPSISQPHFNSAVVLIRYAVHTETFLAKAELDNNPRKTKPKINLFI